MILLAVDSEMRSDHALPVVAALALAGSQQVLALHVSEGVWLPADPAERPARRLAEFGVDARWDTLVTPDRDVSGAILRRARVEGASLIALGSHGRTSLGGVLVGSVSHRVLAGADCQVLIVPGSGAAGPTFPAEISRILVAVDLSAESASALAAVERLAPRLGARVLITHVSDAYQAYRDGSYLQALEAARDRVRQAVQRLRTLGVRAEWTIPAALWSVPQRIAGVADEWQADLLVVGCRRHPELASVLVGSVTHRLIHLTTRPMLVAERPARPARVGARQMSELRLAVKLGES